MFFMALRPRLIGYVAISHFLKIPFNPEQNLYLTGLAEGSNCCSFSGSPKDFNAYYVSYADSCCTEKSENMCLCDNAACMVQDWAPAL